MIKRNTVESGLKAYLFFALIFIFNTAMHAQTEVSSETKNYRNISELDEKPDFPGGIQEFYKFIRDNYQTPKVQGLAGKLYLTFIIEKDGSLTDIKVLRDIGYSTGKEAIRVLQNSPKWIPGKQKGEPVRVLYSLPITIHADRTSNTQKLDTIKPGEKVYKASSLTQKPTYPGGMQEFYKFAGKFYKIPKTPKDVFLKGTIYVTFLVEKDGSLTNFKILKDLGYGAGEEVIRVLRLSQKWIPGKLNDETVAAQYSLPMSIQEPD